MKRTTKLASLIHAGLLAAGIAAVALPQVAQANSPGALGPSFYDFSYGGGTDFFTFTVTTTNPGDYVAALAYNLNGTGTGTDTLTFYNGATVLQSATGNSGSAAVIAYLAAGTYTLGVSATGTGFYNGLFQDYGGGTITGVSAVPEPETYALMGVGLLMIGGVARRRNKAPRLVVHAYS